MPSHEEIKAGVESPRNLGKGGPETMGSLKDMMDKVGQQFGGARRGGAMTRKMRRKASLSRRRSYRRRVKSSPCRKKGPAVCRSMKNCKFVSKKRRYCRKSKNTRRRSRGGARRGGKRGHCSGGSKGHCSGGARRGGARRGGARRGGARR